jgi:hypothetical protein
MASASTSALPPEHPTTPQEASSMRHFPSISSYPNTPTNRQSRVNHGDKTYPQGIVHQNLFHITIAVTPAIYILGIWDPTISFGNITCLQVFVSHPHNLLRHHVSRIGGQPDQDEIVAPTNIIQGAIPAYQRLRRFHSDQR